jgi:hypothetical protein
VSIQAHALVFDVGFTEGHGLNLRAQQVVPGMASQPLSSDGSEIQTIPSNRERCSKCSKQL